MKGNAMMSDAQIEEAARLFGILAEPSRLKLLRALMEEARTVGELMEETGMKQGNVSKHLGVLLGGRYVGREREGNYVRYRLVDKKLYEICEIMCARMEKDARRRVKALVK